MNPTTIIGPRRANTADLKCCGAVGHDDHVSDAFDTHEEDSRDSSVPAEKSARLGAGSVVSPGPLREN